MGEKGLSSANEPAPVTVSKATAATGAAMTESVSGRFEEAARRAQERINQRAAGAQQRAAEHIPANAARPRATTRPTPLKRRPRWAVPVGVGVLLGAVALFVVTRHHTTKPKARTAPVTVTTANAGSATTAAVRPAGPVGPLVGFDGNYQITVENVYISGASGGFATGHLLRSGATVTARYDGASGSGSATVELPDGPAKVTCAADGTCSMQWAGAFPVAIDGNLGHAVLERADGTPLNASACGLPIPSDGSVTPKFGLVDERPQVQEFRLTTGTALSAADGCANAVVIGYDIIATRAA